MEENISLEKRILSTNDWGLVAMLHEGLINQFNKSILSIENKNYEELNIIVNKSRDILAELLVIMSGEDDLSTDTRELYLYTNKLITEGEIKKDISAFQGGIRLINPLWEGFKEMELREEAPVVTGLTYGKTDLDEHLRKEGKTFQG